MSGLDVQLDSECANTLEDLLNKVGTILPEPSEHETTADAQGTHLLCTYLCRLQRNICSYIKTLII